jgi:membrane-bound lytic murein transglycosylase B
LEPVLTSAPHPLQAKANIAKTLRHCDYSASKAAHNFAVLQKWNESEVYAKTVAHFANRLAKEP